MGVKPDPAMLGYKERLKTLPVPSLYAESIKLNTALGMYKGRMTERRIQKLPINRTLTRAFYRTLMQINAVTERLLELTGDKPQLRVRLLRKLAFERKTLNCRTCGKRGPGGSMLDWYNIPERVALRSWLERTPKVPTEEEVDGMVAAWSVFCKKCAIKIGAMGDGDMDLWNITSRIGGSSLAGVAETPAKDTRSEWALPGDNAKEGSK